MTRFTLDGVAVEARPGETIWDVSKRLGTVIPHLCHADRKGYTASGNCRACVVAIDGERTLAPSCRRAPAEGMVVASSGERVERARKMVFELLDSGQPEDSHFCRMAHAVGSGRDARAPIGLGARASRP